MIRKALQFFMFSVFCLLASYSLNTVHAMDVSDKGDPALSVSSAPPSGGIGAKGDPALSVSSSPKLDSAACRSLVRHTPDADVTYQPGVGANGKAVAPADLPGGTQIQLPKTITIPLTLGLARALNLDTTKYPASEFGDTTEIPLGTLTVSGEHVLLNGKPISDDQQSNLAVLCMKENGK